MLQAWSRFWFTPADPTPLGVIRILCGIMVLYIHLAYSYDLMNFHGPEAWLDKAMMDDLRNNAPYVRPTLTWDEAIPTPTDDPKETAFFQRWGMFPSQALYVGHPLFSIWFHVTDPNWMWVCHGAILFIMLLFTVGFCTRVTSVLTWLSILSYINRAQTSLFGMDTIMNLLVFYLMIGPSGAALSVDRLLSRIWRRRRAAREGTLLADEEPPVPSVRANFALRLLQLHVCIIYFTSGMSKLLGQAWWNGTAPWGTMANYEFSPMGYEWYMNALRFLVAHRWLWEVSMTGTALFTLAFEIGFAFAMFVAYALGPQNMWSGYLRSLMIASAVLLHLGIAVFMGLVTFSLMMLIAVSSFIPAETWHDLLRKLHVERGPVHLAYVTAKAA
jgi:hypothetical protein